MTQQEYENIQRDLSALIGQYKRKHIASSKYCEVYEEAILRCKSVLSNYNPRRDKNVNGATADKG